MSLNFLKRATQRLLHIKYIHSNRNSFTRHLSLQRSNQSSNIIQRFCLRILRLRSARFLALVLFIIQMQILLAYLTLFLSGSVPFQRFSSHVIINGHDPIQSSLSYFWSWFSHPMQMIGSGVNFVASAAQPPIRLGPQPSPNISDVIQTLSNCSSLRYEF